MSTLYTLDFHQQGDYFFEIYLILSSNKKINGLLKNLHTQLKRTYCLLVNTKPIVSYKELKYLSLVRCNDLELILIEISALGFVTKLVKHFKNLLNLFNCDTNKMMMSYSEVEIKCSYYIYCGRNKEWLTP